MYVSQLIIPRITADEILSLIQQPQHAGGCSRHVYFYSDDIVVKIDRRGMRYNEDELDIWNRVRDTEIAKFFAPILGSVDYRANGSLFLGGYNLAILMKRVTPHSRYHKTSPSH